MKKLSLVVAILTFFFSGVVLGQHRNPDNSAPPNQPPPQAQPRDGDKAQPRDGDHAKPRDQGRPAPRRPGQVVVVPAPGWPWGYPYPYPHGYPPYGFRVFTEWQTSRVRLDIEPDDAQVFVDRYYAGVVNDYDGFFQRLTLRAGPHLVEIRKEGFRPLGIELNLYPGQDVTYRRTMEPSTVGDETVAVQPVAPAFEEGAVLPPVDAPQGDLKFDVTPKEAAIYADGFYVGIVDDFDGSQHMMLTQGTHHLVLTLDGYETIEVDLSIDSDRTITYRATMKKLARTS